MADLGELLGMLMVSLARAREMADLETAAIAERYKDHPLLEGISLPRIRVPELTMELPILIDSEESGEAPTPESPEVIEREVDRSLEESASRNGVQIPNDARQRFRESLRHALVRAGGVSVSATQPAASRETVVRSVEASLVASLGTPELRGIIAGDKLKALISDVRRRADEVAERTPGKPPRINATIMTSEVKEKAGAGNATQVRLTLREEGLEWSIVKRDDGTLTRSLQPE